MKFDPSYKVISGAYGYSVERTDIMAGVSHVYGLYSTKDGADQASDHLKIRLIVFRELDTAHTENGYPLPSWTSQAIAEDLARHSPALDDKDPADLVPAVMEWLQQKRTKA
jgi:hypothetical protein